MNNTGSKHGIFLFFYFFILSCSFESNDKSSTETHDFKKSNKPIRIVEVKKVVSPIKLSVYKNPFIVEKNIFSFGFSSTKPGAISYSGSCISSTRIAIMGYHQIRFVTMVEGTYDDCAIQVTDADGNTSAPLKVPSFRVDFTVPELSQIGDKRIVGRIVKMEIKASEEGNLVYSGNCNGDLLHAKKGKSEVTVNFPGNGQYSDCEISLSDASGNTSKPLSLGTIRIDATPPVLAEIKPVPEKIQTVRTSYSFKTSKSGTLNFNGKCKGNVDKAVAGINHIALLTAESGIYSDCSLTLTDSSNNQSQPLKISPFEVLDNS